ncbi:MAG: HEAT repeat domain-containing protein, partial [Deltaproteobacteria bacterium]|nr:HEAT repeat domain-containing protein [Deltaproteobacteria bacterium]
MQQEQMLSSCKFEGCGGQSNFAAEPYVIPAPCLSAGREAGISWYSLDTPKRASTSAARNGHILLAQAGSGAVAGAKPVDPIYDSLSSENPKLRISAIRKIGDMGKKTADVYLPALLFLTQDPNIEVQYEAATAIGKVEIVTPEVIEALVMQTMLEMKVSYGEKDKDGEMSVIIHYPNSKLRDEKTNGKFKEVALSLAKKAPNIAVPTLTKWLDSLNDIPAHDSFLSILDLLGELGPVAKSAIPPISKKLKSEQVY